MNKIRDLFSYCIPLLLTQLDCYHLDMAELIVLAVKLKEILNSCQD